MSESSGGSRHTNETNSVTGAEAGNEAVSEPSLPSVEERVAEFREEFGDRARLPLTEEPGQRIRASLTEETWTEVPVPAQVESDTGTTVHELEKRVPLTWEEAVEQLLESHEEARDTTLKLARGYEGDPEHSVFYTEAETSWMRSYQKRYFAELKGWVREAIGGCRPSGGECSGKFDNPTVVLITRTASSVPEGRRRSPVDHSELLRDAWEPVYHTLRNRLRSLGFDSDQWDYYRKEEPHTSERGGGLNQCYTHEHLMLIVDGEVSAADFGPVVDKHVEVCEWAGEDAHSLDRAVEVKDAEEVEDVAAYVASYTGIQPKDLAERSIEYVAWAATQWAANRNRRTRSNAAGHAATADACKQRFESERSDQDVAHAEEVVPSTRRGVEFECRECGSPWGVDQDHETLANARLSGGGDGGEIAADGGLEVPDREEQLRERWPSADAAASVGVTPTEKRKLKKIRRYLNGRPDASVSEVLGACSLGPGEEELVKEVMMDVDRAQVVGFDRVPDWRLDAVVVDEEEYPAASGGGVDMAEIVKPVDRLLRETRLRYHGERGSPTILVRGVGGGAEYVASFDARQQARRLVDLGLTEPWAAELYLEFERRYPGCELSDCFEEPETEPPDRLV